MTSSETSSLIWSIAEILRSSYKEHEYGDVVLPFVVLRRLDCVLESTKSEVFAVHKRFEGSTLHDGMCRKASEQAFYNTSRFMTLADLVDEPDALLANLMDYVRGFSEDVRDVFDKFKFEATAQGLDDKDLLFHVVSTMAGVDLSPDYVDNARMGDIYEELLRRFSEMSNETAGEHFSPRDGLALAVDLVTANSADDLMTPGRVVKCYDPCCGTGGALTAFEDRVAAMNPRAYVRVFGQEVNDQTFAMCKADMLIKGQDPANVRFGDTLSDDRFPAETFGYQVSNPPYGVDWKKDRRAVDAEAKRGFSGRFGAGTPRVSDGQLLFVEHMVSKMRPKKEGGARVAVFLNGSPLFTGGAGSGESEIRRWLLESDLVDAIVAMPNDFFYNTGIATYVWVLDNDKPAERRRKVQLINANGVYTRMRKSLGSKRNELTEEQRRQIVDAYEAYRESDVCRILDVADLGYTTVTVERPLRDEKGEPVLDRRGRPKPDKSLRDTENVPLKEDVDEYLDREVRPYAPDAWADRSLDKVGYEIPFTRYFYRYEPLRPSSEILAEIRELEVSIAEKLERTMGR